MVMQRNQNRHQDSDQRGMAAILVTIILMIVISIIVLGFAQVVRREQQNSLDNQLSTQAYYAAESGVNLAQSELKANPALAEKTDCADSGVFAGKFNVGEGADITCLLITKKLPNLQYQKIDMHSVPMLVQADLGANITEISISWESPASTNLDGCATYTPPSTTTHPASSGNCQPVLRLDLVPITGASMPVAGVAGNQFTTFLYPVVSSSTSIVYSPGSVQDTDNVQCTASGTPKKCTATITGLNANQYAMRVMSIYGESDMTVSAKSGATTVNLINGQVLIDATAKASDVLKRVQARMSLTTGVPDFALVSGGEGICKRYEKSGTVVSINGTHPACNNAP